MVLFFILLLVFPHMDKALSTHMELRKLSGAGAEETNHPDQVTVQRQMRYFIGRPLTPCTFYTRCKRSDPAPQPPPPRKRGH
ncbi:unnamed protein product [Microthlaspi erraticum]|uniref:Uncharacterized protein n=1 Tax=Microthlaspi erraticum TaxID=1685480 RepID=A0A6D2LFL7_9BRAS|nr:unnamed protein product [Microthlaspi erraticum]